MREGNSTGNLLLKNMRIINADEEFLGDILVVGNNIEKVGNNIEPIEPCKIIEGNGKYVAMPSLFDMHVHFRDPGYTYKEDIYTGAMAALAGGFTDVACMPNTNPVTDNEEVLEYILSKALDTGVNVHPVASITKGLEGECLCQYNILKAAGAVAVSDDGRPVKNAEMMRKALTEASKSNLLVISHCEDLDIIDGGIINKGKISEKLNLKGMDRKSEDSITAREISLAESTDTRIHIAHVSTKGAVSIIRDAKNRNIKVTCETCPHYFIYTDEKLLSLDADYRMNPPLREESDRAAIMEAVLDGTIDCIVTDHAPHTEEEKSNFIKAPNGVIGLETSLAATLTALYHTGKADLKKIVALMSSNPRSVMGLKEQKIAEGYEADIIVVNVDREWTVRKENLHSKSKNTVFKGEKFKGKVLMTISCGEIRYQD